jgi:hypothetical protein
LFGAGKRVGEIDIDRWIGLEGFGEVAASALSNSLLVITAEFAVTVYDFLMLLVLPATLTAWSESVLISSWA